MPASLISDRDRSINRYMYINHLRTIHTECILETVILYTIPSLHTTGHLTITATDTVCELCRYMLTDMFTEESHIIATTIYGIVHIPDIM